MLPINKVAIVGCVFAISACANSQDSAMPGSDDSVNITYEYKRDRVEEQVDNIPGWFKSQPEDTTKIYSAGTAVTPDLQFAVDIAVLNAKVILADRINSRLRAQAKQFKAKVGSGDLDASIISEFERAVKNITADTDVSGYHLAKTAIYPHGTQYRAFVLLEYSDAEARKILTNRIRKNEMLYNRLRATKAWRELDKNAENQKKEEASRRKHDLDALNALNSL